MPYLAVAKRERVSPTPSLEFVRINTGTYLYDIIQRSEFPLTLSFALTIGVSPLRGCFILVTVPG